MVPKIMKAAQTDYTAIIHSVLQGDSSLPHVLIYEYDKTKVYRIDLPTPLILRMLEGDTSSYEYRAALQSQLAADDGLTSQILHWETRQIHERPYGIQIQTLISGEPIDHFPSEQESKAIIHATYILHQRLSQATEKLGTNAAPDIHTIINQLLPAVKDSPLKEAALKLVNHSRYRALMSQPEQTLIYGDMWYKNLLLEKNGSETAVRFVDIDPLFVGPALLQPAILFSSYFLFARLLLEPKAMAAFDLGKYFSLWSEPLNELDMLLMMYVFPVGLGLLKELQFSQAEDADPQIQQSTLKPFEESVAFLNGYMTEHNYHW